MKWFSIPQIALFTILLLAAACTSTPDYPANDAAQSTDDADTADAADDGGGEPDAADAQPDLGPCDGSCGGETPHCETESGACVSCLDDAHCDDGVCADDNTCVGCLGDGDCDTGVCDTDANACVECVEDTHCDDPTTSACGGDNTCTGCASDAECSHLEDTAVCDTDASTCVECTVDDESACNGNSCDPATNSCTETPVGTVDTCGACKADSECKSDHRCISMEFDGQALDDGFCLKTVASGCDQPYSISITRASLSGASEDSYCGISEALTTCSAIRDLEQSVECDSDDDCGGDGLQDGRCELVGTLANRCTYSCATNDNCPIGKDCASGTTDSKYCGGL